MDAEAVFEGFLERNGLRLTEQRRQILRVFLATEKHVTAQELYDLVRKRYKGIGYATIARTIKVLDGAGICRQVDFGDGCQRFEHKFGHEHHDHLICLKCGKLVEIFSKRLEKIQDELVKKHEFVSEYHKLDIFGICLKCQKEKKRRKR